LKIGRRSERFDSNIHFRVGQLVKSCGTFLCRAETRRPAVVVNAEIGIEAWRFAKTHRQIGIPTSARQRASHGLSRLQGLVKNKYLNIVVVRKRYAASRDTSRQGLDSLNADGVPRLLHSWLLGSARKQKRALPHRDVVTRLRQAHCVGIEEYRGDLSDAAVEVAAHRRNSDPGSGVRPTLDH
jgi:hypothetical protein